MKIAISPGDWGVDVKGFEKGGCVDIEIRGKVESMSDDEVIVSVSSLSLSSRSKDDESYPVPGEYEKDSSETKVRVDVSRKVDRSTPSVLRLVFGE